MRCDTFWPWSSCLHASITLINLILITITNICYGRGVGYKIEEIVLDEETQKISATKIRAKMREEGKLT